MFGNKLHFFVFISFILYVQKYFFAAKGCISRMTTNKNRFSNLKEFPPYNQIKYNSVQLLYIDCNYTGGNEVCIWETEHIVLRCSLTNPRRMANTEYCQLLTVYIS